MIKSKWIIFIFIIILTGCTGVRIIDYKGSEPYGILVNRNIQREGIKEKNTSVMNSKIRGEYGIIFWDFYEFSSPGEKFESPNNYINFYNDINLIVDGVKYIISKEKIEKSTTSHGGPKYSFIPLNDYWKDEYKELIVDLGEIEIITETGKIVKPRRKIPPIVFKQTYHVTAIDFTHRMNLYYGWLSDYPKGVKKEELAPAYRYSYKDGIGTTTKLPSGEYILLEDPESSYLLIDGKFRRKENIKSEK